MRPIKLIKKLFWGIAILIFALGCLIAILLVDQSIDREDTFYIENAVFADLSILNRLSVTGQNNSFFLDNLYPVNIHRLARGSGSIFAYHFFSNRSVWAIDDEYFTKLTVWTAAPPPPDSAEFDLTDDSVLVLFTLGGSAWPQHGCPGRIGPPGSLKIVRTRNGYLINTTGTLKPVTNTDHCLKERIEMEFKAKKLPFEKLTPWLGLAGEHIYDETYRR